jgi:hypothetical protein
LTTSRRCSYTKFAVATVPFSAANRPIVRREKVITLFLQHCAETLKDPVLRRWRWQRLLHRTAPPQTPPPVRPGDAAALGCPLYVDALACGDEPAAARGVRLLFNAALDGIGESGITREGSSLRQRQLAGLYVTAWLAARRAGRTEQRRLAAIADAVLAALAAITLAGGLPEIGASPGPPESGLDRLSTEDRLALAELRRHCHLDDLELLRQDGWLRLDRGPWSGLWHCPPGGWPAEGGLAHHDLGAAELHWQGAPLFVDPGAPAEQDKDQAARAAAATGHGGLSLDGLAPYPDSRPCYDAAFRRRIAGPPPELRTSAEGVRLSMDGFGRIGGHIQVERHWHLKPDGLYLDDLVLGTGQPRIERRLFTPWTVRRDGEALLLSRDRQVLRLSGEFAATLQPARQWRENGVESALTQICFTQSVNLPWRGALVLHSET